MATNLLVSATYQIILYIDIAQVRVTEPKGRPDKIEYSLI